jgi:DNA-binding transcriptional ArsR family regulator
VTQPTPASPPRWELYRLLSDPVRLALLALLAEDELAVGELAEILGEGQPKISRHAAQLREADIVQARKHGTWVLLSLARGARRDPVVADALAAGRALAERDDLFAKAESVVSARDERSKEFFARATQKPTRPSLLPREAAVFLAGVGPLLARRRLAVDAGTGDGLLLELLAPLFEEVLAIDRSPERLEQAKARVARHRVDNVAFEVGELESPSVDAAVRARCAAGADLVIASRVLHHAALPRKAMASLAGLLRSGGTLLVIDYAPHDEGRLASDEADLWLGFSTGELEDFARGAGLVDVHLREFLPTGLPEGPDSHIPWTLFSATRP